MQTGNETDVANLAGAFTLLRKFLKYEWQVFGYMTT